MSGAPLRVVHLSAYDNVGGAPRAARALHEAMLNAGLDSLLVVGKASGHTPATRAPHPKRFMVAGELDRQLWRLTRSPRPTWRSPALFGALSARAINALSADVINLHWITGGLLSVRQISQLRPPIAWSMYDMWPFSGTEHYLSLPERYENSYARDTRPADESGLDLDRWTWLRKKKHWQTPLTMIPASRWLETCVRSSSLMASWPVKRIPHLIDIDTYLPSDRNAAREHFGLPKDRKLIAFIATAGISDERKGWRYLRNAAERSRIQDPDIEVVVIGPRSTDRQPFPVHWLGEISSARDLNLAYAAADIIATPSTQDTMPLSAMEAQASGRAVVGFEVGGLPDIVEHGQTGMLAPAFDPDALSRCISKALDQADSLGAAARIRAAQLWSPTNVVTAYHSLYQELRRSRLQH